MLDALTAYPERLYEDYFTSGVQAREYRLIVDSIVVLVLASAVAFFGYGFQTIPSAEVFLGGVVGFSVLSGLHVVLFLVGAPARHGAVKAAKLAVFVPVVFTVLLIVGTVALYGWVVPVAILTYGVNSLSAPYSAMVTPFAIVAMFVIAVAWYAKGLGVIDGGV